MNKRFIWTLAIIAIIANILDFLTTIIALGMGKRESNPIMAYLISIDPWLFSLVKLIVVIYFVLPMKYSPIGFLINKKSVWENVAVILLIFLITYFSLLGISNLFVII